MKKGRAQAKSQQCDVADGASAHFFFSEQSGRPYHQHDGHDDETTVDDASA